MRWLTLSLFALATLTSSNALAAGSRGKPATTPQSGPILQLAPTLDDIYTNVLQPVCSICHRTGSGFGWIADTKLTTWNTLVNQPSEFCPGAIRVIPGNPDDSALIQALEGTSPCLDQMPLGDLPLPQTTIDVIRNWITAGALFETPPVPAQAVTWSGVKALYR